MLISERLCTLNELRTIYSLEDAYLMHEALAVPKYNEWLSNERAMKKAKLGKG